MTTIIEKYTNKKKSIEIQVHARKYTEMLGIKEPDPEGDAETARVMREMELANKLKQESHAIAVRNSMRCVIL